MTTLLYIAGFARSGSTLLELLLATHPDAVTTGELQVLPHEVQRSDGTMDCSCGAPVLDCPHWRAVVEAANPLLQTPPRLHHFRETHRWGDTLRRPRSHASIADATRYAANTMEVVEAVADATQKRTGIRPRVVVDASKDPYRAKWLVAGGAPVRVVHLSRDPRGVVNSLTRGRGHPGRIVARRALAWSIENQVILREVAQRADDDTYRHLRYEDLVERPVDALEQITDFVGLPPHPAAVEEFRTVAVHAIAGNVMRQDRRPIVADQRWRSDLPANRRRTVELLTTPTARKLGHR